MNRKKALCIMTAIFLISGMIAGCTHSADPAVATEIVTVTDKSGDTVTRKDGKAVTEIKKITEKQTEKNSTAPTKQKASGGKTTSSASDTSAGNAEEKNTSATSSGTKPSSVPGTSKKTETTKKPSSTVPKSKPNPETKPTAAPAPAPISIKLEKNSNADCSSDNVTIGMGTVQIDKGGSYVITQDTGSQKWHGQIIVKLKNTESAELRFENVNISNTSPNIIKIIDTSIKTDRSFIEAEATTGTNSDNQLKDEMKLVSKNEKAPNVDLSFPTGTKSTFETSANSFTGVVYNESKLTIRGNGEVRFTASRNANNVICSTKSLTIKNVTANLTTSDADVNSSLSSAKGIFSYSRVDIESGRLYIRSNGDCIRCDDFNLYHGNVDLNSGAADGIDADDSICIYDGNINSIALKKSCFKVRRVNNQEALREGDNTIKKEDGITDKAKHTFKINGGIVRGESKNITTVQSSTQPSITCRSVKAPNSTEAKKLISFKITGNGIQEKHSYNKCIKFIYSSNEIRKNGDYTVASQGYESTKVTFKGNVGDARIVANR